MKPFVSLTSILLLFTAPSAGIRAEIIVHEWGTMTTLHAPDGRAEGRLNFVVGAEPLPQFVYRFEPSQRVTSRFAPFAKGYRSQGRPDVTMRLETPVLYFYDPGNELDGRSFDVRVLMRGGVLNEFFPRAQAGIQERGVDRTRQVISSITLDSSWSTTLAWTGVTLDPSVAVPRTSVPVWLAPREVQASKLRVGKDGEHYLFYRGVANLPALLSTRHSPSHVVLSPPADLSWMPGENEVISQAWLIDVRADGSLAFATRKNLILSKYATTEPLAELARFTSKDFSSQQRAALRQSMKAALIDSGLYADEAEAMLRTWEASYFRQPGLRVFYTVPRAWTDHYLPLELSVPHDAARVLIGRIDLMTAGETT